MKLNEIQSLIRFVAKSKVSEVELEMKDFTLRVKNPMAEPEIPKVETPVIMPYMQPAPPMHPQPPATPPSAPAPPAAPSEKKEAEAPAAAQDESKYHVVKSPMIGTFYRSPDPDKPPFVNVGDEVKKGQPICIIEAMKLFNEIESEVSGKIVKLLVDDQSPVEYEAPLFLIDPS